jgi:alpha 1,2-mannosyltransferase
MLARNGDLPGVVKSMKQMEDRFNKRFRYPYVFLNEEPFTDQFKECVTLFIKVDYTLLILTALATRRAGE